MTESTALQTNNNDLFHFQYGSAFEEKFKWTACAPLCAKGDIKGNSSKRRDQTGSFKSQNHRAVFIMDVTF